MSSSTFLVIDKQPISVEQALSYLQFAGMLRSVLLEILRQHVLTLELQTRINLRPPPDIVEQVFQEFRQSHDLLESKALQIWLDNNNLDREQLHQQFIREWSLQQLKHQISQPTLQKYFDQHRHELDQIVLSCIAVGNIALAENLYDQIQQGISFNEIAKAYSLAEGRDDGGRIAPIHWSALRNELKNAIATASIGSIIGPIAINQHWYLIRVEAFLPAALEGELEEQLRTEIFDQWLIEKIETLTLELPASVDLTTKKSASPVVAGPDYFGALDSNWADHTNPNYSNPCVGFRFAPPNLLI